MPRNAAQQPEISVILATYNRCNVLRGALQSLLHQDNRGIEYEVVVVDNNSSDDTRSMVEELRDNGHPNLVYSFEKKQGVSYARNNGIAAARAPILAFTDDDIRVAPDWIWSISQGFKRFPQADCIGGKVLPQPATEFPAWLTTMHWSPLALLDLGDEPVQLNVYTGAGLVGANLVVRASVFADVGLFEPELQRVKDSIGSLEDHEFQLRVSAARKQLMYLPDLVVHADVLDERLTKDYHRRWHRGHGFFFALLRDDEFEMSKIRLFDVPAHLYRSTWSNVVDLLRYRLKGKSDLEFQQEIEIHFFLGFLRKRLADRRSIFQLSQHGPDKNNVAQKIET